MKRRHSMPFGAEVLDDGAVRFRLWAPAAARVDLCLERNGGTLELPLQPVGAGWYELVTAAAAAGAATASASTAARASPIPPRAFSRTTCRGRAR